MKTTVTKKAFQTWLETKSPRTVVGIVLNMEHCPLANYFTEKNNLTLKENPSHIFPFVMVDDKVYIYKGSRHISAKLKPWMKKFIQEIDSLEYINHSNFKVTAKKALDILETC